MSVNDEVRFSAQECYEAFRERRMMNLHDGGMAEWRQVSSDAKFAWDEVANLFNEAVKQLTINHEARMDEVIRSTSARVTELDRIIEEYQTTGETKQS